MNCFYFKAENRLEWKVHFKRYSNMLRFRLVSMQEVTYILNKSKTHEIWKLVTSKMAKPTSFCTNAVVGSVSRYWILKVGKVSSFWRVFSRKPIWPRTSRTMFKMFLISLLPQQIFLRNWVCISLKSNIANQKRTLLRMHIRKTM